MLHNAVMDVRAGAVRCSLHLSAPRPLTLDDYQAATSYLGHLLARHCAKLSEPGHHPLTIRTEEGESAVGGLTVTQGALY